MIHVYEIHRRQFIPKPLAELFGFFEKPENLGRLTPKGLGFQMLTPPPLTMRTGAVIDYIITVAGFNVHWRTLISSYEPPHLFIDEQAQGPYLFWHHTHRFQETDDGTVMIDHVRYAMPFGFLGRMAHFLFVGRQLRGIFDYRADAIAQLFETGGSAGRNDREAGRPADTASFGRETI